MRFTNSAIKAIPTPDRITDFRDRTRPNLVLKITKNDCRTFYFIFKDREGKRTGIKVGRYTGPGSFNAIMTKYAQLFTAYHLGEDLLADPKKKEAPKDETPTIDFVIEEYLEHLRTRKSHSTFQNAKSQLRKHVSPAIGSKKVDSVKRADVVRLVDATQDNGLTTGTNYVLARVKAMFTWMVDRGYIETSPLQGIKRPVPTKSKRLALSDTQITQMLDALDSTDSIPEQSKTVIKIILLTGVRREEASGMLWSELDFEANVWRLGKDRPLKTASSARDVPLTDTLKELISSRLKARKDDRVFKLSKSTIGIHCKTFKDKELPDLPVTLHVLRHTWIDLSKRLHVPREVSMAVTGHSFSDLHATYEHYTYLEEARVAMEKVDKHVAGLRS